MPRYLSTAKMEAASARFASWVYAGKGLELNDTYAMFHAASLRYFEVGVMDFVISC